MKARAFALVAALVAAAGGCGPAPLSPEIARGPDYVPRTHPSIPEPIDLALSYQNDVATLRLTFRTWGHPIGQLGDWFVTFSIETDRTDGTAPFGVTTPGDPYWPAGVYFIPEGATVDDIQWITDVDCRMYGDAILYVSFPDSLLRGQGRISGLRCVVGDAHTGAGDRPFTMRVPGPTWQPSGRMIP